MSKNVLIRADGDKTMGYGHLVRCMSLAHMIKDAFQIIFYTKNIPPEIEEEANSHGFGIKKISTEEEFFDNIRPGSITVLDGYNFDVKYQETIKSRHSKLVYIDDLCNQKFLADVIINHAPGINKGCYQAQPYTKYLLGQDYALLRPAFLKAAKENIQQKPLKEIFICFGGSDYSNLTETVINCILNQSTQLKINVVVSAINPHLAQLKTIQQEHSSLNIQVGLSQEQMVNLMKQSQIAIVPASGILFEVLAVGLQTVSGYYIDNQKSIYEGFKKINAFFDAMQFKKRQLTTAFVNAEKSLLQNKNSDIRLIDGLSGERIKTSFLNL
ncbi:UDP-2,4-diacetamido-2,4,6-trideoxy-beta-L-altropyranose hydrolase [Fulvivirga sp. 29W222]|uniref:UDP-2,4-diacetamido-2,4, 6-trideoxy-beta-L-altropyranose hydrolase n=1 Tax=Fulvivirga marina TaxID=2494733 RepID=A0A937G375_9BACT|nr:UDP-2,4-diacetamido-2,4,6-trideoxy-beta-L-altropyranose hydrolase [Fulvivirga marina]MBL6449857.1 UDP-2,4-diacetamido-2,4,6-trideoxy-beta-L-altropyranose hydrolase [Fulvivirga marina]